jgi:hypothetical protein
MAQAAMVGMMGASLLMQVSAEYKAGQEEAYALELEGKQDEVSVIQLEADRKRDLARVLASQNAEAGAGNIAFFEGSPLAIMQEDIKTEQEYTDREKYEYGLRKRVRRRRARNVKDASYVKMVSGLLMGGSAMAGSVGGGGTKPTRMGTSITQAGYKPKQTGVQFSGTSGQRVG